MPEKRVHLKFDKYLIEHSVICDRDCSTVHEQMDKGIKVYGPLNHQLEDFNHQIDGVRVWIRSWSHLANQETKTDYIRVAYGHSVLDEIWSEDKTKSEEELMKSAYRSYTQKGFDKCHFKE